MIYLQKAAAAAGEKQAKKKAAKEDTGPKIKKARSAYIFFSSDKRAEVKGALAHRVEHCALDYQHRVLHVVPGAAAADIDKALSPELCHESAAAHPEYTLGEVSKELGAMWSSLSMEDEAQYQVC